MIQEPQGKKKGIAITIFYLDCGPTNTNWLVPAFSSLLTSSPSCMEKQGTTSLLMRNICTASFDRQTFSEVVWAGNDERFTAI